MGITLCAAVVALLCIGASARRLAWAVAPTRLDPALVREALAAPDASAVIQGLRRELAGDSRFRWEGEVIAAFDEPEGPTRDALVNEALLEFEGRADRWVRVPRVCASIGTSGGLLFGSIALLHGLSMAPGDDGGNAAVQAVLASALQGVSFGILATAFCAAVHVRSTRAARRARVDVDALIERLRWVSDKARRGA
jgi:hypothetical protein